MMRKIGWITLSLGASMLVILLALFSQPALAQTEQPEKDQTCWDCHSNLYALHDTGKWLCMCGTKARCTFCHGGVVGEVDVDAAHEGLIANPLRDNAVVCQNCHPLDYTEHVMKFAALGGINPTPLPEPTYIPLYEAYSKALSAPVAQGPISPWRWAGLALASLGLMGAIIFGIHCCQQDRKSKEEIANHIDQRARPTR